jgi:SAM-dependent methyltransferase
MPRTQPFDQFADEYEAWFDRHPFVYLSELEAIRHFVPKNEAGIEIGIGTGRFALPLGIGFGVEPSESMRARCRAKGLKVLDAAAEKLPLASRSFDFALMVTTVCFVDDVERSFREAHRVVRPGGHFVIGLVDRRSPLGRKYERIKESNRFYRPATFYSTGEIMDLLSRTGFRDFQVVQTVFGELDGIREIQPFKRGYEQGGFVVMNAARPTCPE